MSEPVEPDYAVIKVGDGATPTEVFSIVCGVQDVTINATANITDRFVRDCANPNVAPNRKTKLTGKQWDVSGSGLIDKAQLGALNTALGKVKNAKIELYSDDGASGLLYATYSGAFRIASVNLNLSRESESTVEITMPSHGAITLALA